jgi:hypothetical protein
MIKGFEELTHELTPYERDVLLPAIRLGLLGRKGKERAITNPTMVKILKEKGYKKTNEPRIRKIIFILRATNEVPRLIATSKGYYIATTKKELYDWSVSMQGRIDALNETLSYAKRQINEWDNPNTQQKFNYGK